MSTTPDDAAKERLFEEFNAVLAETERFLKTVAGAGSDKAVPTRMPRSGRRRRCGASA